MKTSTTTWVLLSGVVAVTGRWSQGKTLDPTMVIAVFFLALMLAIFEEVSEELAQAFALLILISFTFAYAPDILKRLKLK